MKLEQLFEASEKPWLQTLRILKGTDEWKKMMETFDYVSTERQEKNGTLAFETKPELMKYQREYTITLNGEVKFKNKGTTIWAKGSGNIGTDSEDTRFKVWKARLVEVMDAFRDWQIKRMKSKTDVSNSNLKSMTSLLLPEKAKGDNFSCQANFLTDLMGGPIGYVKNYYAQDNDLVSPLVGAPDECHNLYLRRNKLSTWEGIPKILSYLDISENEFKTFKGVSKHFEKLVVISLDLVETGYLEFMNVKGLEQISFYSEQPQTKQLRDIFEKHLKGDRDLLDCQEELISAGLKDFAKL